MAPFLARKWLGDSLHYVAEKSLACFISRTVLTRVLFSGSLGQMVKNVAEGNKNCKFVSFNEVLSSSIATVVYDGSFLLVERMTWRRFFIELVKKLHIFNLSGAPALCKSKKTFCRTSTCCYGVLRNANLS